MQQGMWTPMCRHACDRTHVGRHIGDRVAHSYWPTTSICIQLPWFTFTHSDTPSTKENVAREGEKKEASFEGRPEVKECSFRVLISPDQFIQDIEVGFWDLTSRYQDEDLEGIKGFGQHPESK
ncbi:hypothetical protein IGI04_040013 [Brassica rapa subsp. trilocularis]|uniref:Uncharacterized protein n=1 Tax=Brassica rapa subsp. trilocularis TaxID=1813537 RepID=A0ABQ7KN85_BRACM|nr:hypothetical protein IGI04_040013 [Brassica rapa subsp. trilocularis]